MTLFGLLCLFAGGDLPKTETLRYLRPEGGKFIVESEITVTRDRKEHTYVSRTVRPGETLTLTVRRTPAGQLLKAELVLQQKGTRLLAVVVPSNGKLHLMRGRGGSHDIDLDGSVFFTSAPDWSDVLELARRYDAKKGGAQEFRGVWFHPTKPTLTPKFTVEQVGEDKITAGGLEHRLRRLRVRLRASTNTVWVFPDGRVCKILPDGAKAVPVVLQGYEEATRGLK